MPDSAGEGPVIVNAFCKFYKQLEYPGNVRMKMFVSDPGRTTFESWATMERTDQPGVIHAAGGATIIWVDFPKQKAKALPDCPPRHNSCRLHRTKNPGAAMKDRSWHDTDKHSRTERLLGCCRPKARQRSWWPGRLAWEQEHYGAGAMMFSPCPPEGGHGLRRRA